jgi:hypothetical protein
MRIRFLLSIYSDPDPTFHFKADPDPAPHQKVMRSGTTGLQTIHGFSLRLHASIVSVRGPLWFHFEPRNILSFDFNADPDPAFRSNADPELASQKYSGYGSGFPKYSGSMRIRIRNPEYWWATVRWFSKSYLVLKNLIKWPNSLNSAIIAYNYKYMSVWIVHSLSVLTQTLKLVK